MGNALLAMLRSRFFWARAMAVGEISQPLMERLGNLGERWAWRRREIHPVPVQRSRMFRVCLRGTLLY